MVGNDIVDLRDRDADPRSLSARFDARVFSPDERDAIASSTDAARERWRLWAAKESSYKLAQRLALKQGRNVIFSPIRFQVDLGAKRVTHEATEFALVIRDADDWVHAIALQADAPEQDIVVREQRIADTAPARQSASVRGLACAAIAERFGYACNELSIRSEGRIPGLWLGDRPLAFSLSLSHHGRFVAMAARPETREADATIHFASAASSIHGAMT